jgi:hypothetical protein
MTCLVYAILYFVLLVHPYRYIMFIAYTLLFPTFGVILTYFASRPLVATRSSDGPESDSKGSKGHPGSDSKSGNAVAPVNNTGSMMSFQSLEHSAVATSTE